MIRVSPPVRQARQIDPLTFFLMSSLAFLSNPSAHSVHHCFAIAEVVFNWLVCKMWSSSSTFRPETNKQPPISHSPTNHTTVDKKSDSYQALMFSLRYREEPQRHCYFPLLIGPQSILGPQNQTPRRVGEGLVTSEATYTYLALLRLYILRC